MTEIVTNTLQMEFCMVGEIKQFVSEGAKPFYKYVCVCVCVGGGGGGVFIYACFKHQKFVNITAKLLCWCA